MARIILTVEYLDHCLDSLRQAIMCTSDPSTLFWSREPGESKFALNFESTHRCRSFEKLQELGVLKKYPSGRDPRFA